MDTKQILELLLAIQALVGKPIAWVVLIFQGVQVWVWVYVPNGLMGEPVQGCKVIVNGGDFEFETDEEGLTPKFRVKPGSMIVLVCDGNRNGLQYSKTVRIPRTPRQRQVSIRLTTEAPEEKND